MASLVWVSIFALLCFELALTVLFCAPLPWGFRKMMLRMSMPLKTVQAVRTALLFVHLALGIAFATSLQDMTKAKDKAKDIKINVDSASVVEVWEYSNARQNLFRSERNMYLSLMSLTLSMVLWRLLDLFNNEWRLREKSEAPGETAKKVAQKKGLE